MSSSGTAPLPIDTLKTAISSKPPTWIVAVATPSGATPVVSTKVVQMELGPLDELEHFTFTGRYWNMGEAPVGAAVLNTLLLEGIPLPGVTITGPVPDELDYISSPVVGDPCEPSLDALRARIIRDAAEDMRESGCLEHGDRIAKMGWGEFLAQDDGPW